MSPTMVAESADAFAPAFPGMTSVPADELVQHYVRYAEGEATGQITRAYGTE